MTNTLLQRIAALPTARRGDETIVLVPMNELVALIGDAQASEAALISGAAPIADNPRGLETLLERALDRRSR